MERTPIPIAIGIGTIYLSASLSHSSLLCRSSYAKAQSAEQSRKGRHMNPLKINNYKRMKRILHFNAILYMFKRDIFHASLFCLPLNICIFKPLLRTHLVRCTQNHAGHTHFANFIVWSVRCRLLDFPARLSSALQTENQP